MRLRAGERFTLGWCLSHHDAGVFEGVENTADARAFVGVSV
jgi:hypothetical protein